MESQETETSVDSSDLNANEDNSSTASSGNSTAMTALEELQELFATDPNAERVSFRGRKLSQTEAETTLTFVQNHFPRLRHLDLRDNDLYELPRDFGARLPKLVALNLLNNNFRFRNGALRTLAETLQDCPCLKSLSLTLSSPAEEQMLLAMLPRLRIFNGTPLLSTRPGNEKPNPASPTIQELQFFCASPLAKTSLNSAHSPDQDKKSELQVQLTTSKDKKATEASLARKPGSSVPQRSTKNSLRPKDQPVSITDDRTDWCKLLKLNCSQVPKSVESTASPEATSNAVSTLSTVVPTETFLQQLKAVVKAFHDCDSLSKANNNSKVKLFSQLDRHVELLAQQLKRQEPDDDKTELSEAMLQTRWSLLEKQLLTAMQRQQKSSGKQVDISISAAEESTQKANSAQNQNQLKQLLDVAESLENDLEAVQSKLQQETARREQVEQENRDLKRERSSSVQGNSRAAGSRSSEARWRSNSNNVGTTTQSTRRIRKRSVGRDSTTSGPVEDVHHPEVTSSTQVPPPPAPTVTVRILTLKQLVDLIQCVYASKVKYDARATTAGAPRETMEQHLYTYLNTRFGLPKLIVDYASAVWKSAEHFARRENEAAVFVALLRNRLDEGFLEIKRKLQSAIVELLRVYFTARFSKKQGKAIAALVQNRIDGLLLEDEWRNLLTYLYEPRDSAILLRLVQQKAEKYQALQSQHKKLQPNEKPSLALLFTDFEQVLYGYQLQGRLELLDNFRRAFEELDTDRVGIINRARFFSLSRRIAPMKPESAVTKMVETLDPFSHDVITFSDAANALLPDIRRASVKANSSTPSQIKTKKTS
ncbi:hypothetical protein PHYBOEH_011894 [Phytophthora boehmeriae]|uniref:EF-hand domain-containing protein n=1 Tax=Phytophthora boehmeriae TaxID=109152 RepID=A0A8T1WWH5_9STRA|nr:hypothetical protein PHYBOEH_011894 [Phytophthora boehmeriae]